MRPSWNEYFMEMAHVVAKRATCDRKHVGAVIVDERKRIVSTGYNGAPKGMPHCDEVGHLLKTVNGRDSCVRTLHAESNALDDAGRRAQGCSLYITVSPCLECAKRIINAGIREVFYGEFYPSQNSEDVKDLMREAQVAYRQPDSARCTFLIGGSRKHRCFLPPNHGGVHVAHGDHP